MVFFVVFDRGKEKALIFWVLTTKKKGFLQMKFAGKFQRNTTKETVQKSNIDLETDFLTDYSPKDAPWDVHRAQCDDVTDIYAIASEFERYASRMSECSGWLRFGWSEVDEKGATSLKLKEANFCRVRYCPVCQWRRSLMWLARFFQSLPKIVAEYPNARWLYLTLTVRNPPIAELGVTLTKMNVAWRRLIKREAMKPIKGWIRTTEVTRDAEGNAHPHFHALLMVSQSWFKKSYVKHARWVELWKDALRVDYEPNVDIRTVKQKDKSACEPTSICQYLQGAVAETLKYSVKPEDMTEHPAWFLELTRQTHKRRFIATGGVLKNVLKLDEESDKDLIVMEGEEDGDDDGLRLAFGWKRKERRYRRQLKQDIKK